MHNGKYFHVGKTPLAIEDAVKEELDRLVEKGVLVPMTEPTERVSQMVVVHKPSGKLRMCIDPQPLNEAFKREHYRLVVLDDVLPKLRDAKVFSKFDVREAYWHVKLDKESSKLTTMITSFGQYRWKRRHRVKYGLDYFLDLFLDHFRGGKTHHYYRGRGGMKSISTEGGVGGRVLLLREGFETD